MATSHRTLAPWLQAATACCSLTLSWKCAWSWLALSAATGMILGTGCTDPERMQAEIPGTYKQVEPAGVGLEQIFTLDLRTNFTCTMAREYVKKGKITDTGTWTNSGRIITLTLKPRRAKETSAPIEFKWQGTKITSTKWDANLFGEDGPGTFHKETAATRP